jgi:hypothetical protein
MLGILPINMQATIKFQQIIPKKPPRKNAPPHFEEKVKSQE